MLLISWTWWNYVTNNLENFLNLYFLNLSLLRPLLEKDLIWRVKPNFKKSHTPSQSLLTISNFFKFLDWLVSILVIISGKFYFYLYLATSPSGATYIITSGWGWGLKGLNKPRNKSRTAQWPTTILRGLCLVNYDGISQY